MESQNGNLVHSRSKAACSNVVEGFGVDWQGTLKSRIPENKWEMFTLFMKDMLFLKVPDLAKPTICSLKTIELKVEKV